MHMSHSPNASSGINLAYCLPLYSFEAHLKTHLRAVGLQFKTTMKGRWLGERRTLKTLPEVSCIGCVLAVSHKVKWHLIMASGKNLELNESRLLLRQTATAQTKGLSDIFL